MIWHNNFKQREIGNLKKTIESLEKAKELLNKRFQNKEISNESYIIKAKEIDLQIEKYRKMLNEY